MDPRVRVWVLLKQRLYTEFMEKLIDFTKGRLGPKS
jgi:hypothetical protein